MSKDPVIIDAQGRSLGRVATEAAVLLRGKGSATYERHVMPTQKVVVKNTALIRVTGRKLSQNSYKRYSGYPGGLKLTPMSKVFKKDSREVVKTAITGMIPRNRLRKEILKNLIIYAEDSK